MPNSPQSDDHSVVALFAKNGLGNIFFAIEAAARYAVKFDKNLYVDLNESGHYGDTQKRFEDYFSLRGVDIIRSLNPIDFNIPYPRDIRLFDRTFIDKELIETKPSGSKWGNLKFWKKYDRWMYHWKFKKGGYALRNGEHLGLIGKKHDAILFLTTYIRKEPERFFHLSISDKLLQGASSYFTNHALNQHPDLGIHIRYTDNMHHSGGRLKDGLNKAFRAVLRFLEDRKTETPPIVHLASDNRDVIELFQNQFQGKIELQHLPIDRSTEAMHINNENNKNQFDPYLSAIYDIILLSNSKTLAYMGNSSFSRVARSMQPLHYEAFDWNR